MMSADQQINRASAKQLAPKSSTSPNRRETDPMSDVTPQTDPDAENLFFFFRVVVAAQANAICNATIPSIPPPSPLVHRRYICRARKASAEEGPRLASSSPSRFLRLLIRAAKGATHPEAGEHKRHSPEKKAPFFR